MRKIILLFLFPLSVLLLLNACHQKPRVPTAYIDPLSGGLQEELQAEGVQIIQQGSTLQLILPTDQFFRLQTTQLLDDKRATLDKIGLFLKYYLHNHPTQQRIIVTAYTDTVYSKEMRKALSQSYAEVIASYFWNQGFSEDQLQVRGSGSLNPIASTRTAAGSSYNRRVVIQIRPRAQLKNS